MKVLQINNVYRNGSTGKITYDIHRELQNCGVESVVCYGRGALINEPNVYKTCGELYSKFNNLLSRFTGIMYGGCFFSTQKLLSIIQKEKPDVVHLQCLNGYFVNIYRLITFLKKKKIPTLLTLHAEFMHTANCGYALDCEKWKKGCGNCPRLKAETKSCFLDGTARSWKKMKKAFEGFEKLHVTSVSPWLMERAMQSPILADKKHSVVFNGLDTDVFHPYDTQALREQLKIPQGTKIIFHVTRSFNLNPDHIKGACHVVKLAEMMRGEKVQFVVAGPYDTSKEYPENMLMLGRISDQKELAKLYSLADVTLLTSKKETFSMICAESLCCGTPIVGFKAGAPERISLSDYSYFCEQGDYANLYREIKKFFGQSDAELSGKIASIALETYSQRRMANAYLDGYRQLYGG